MAEFIIMFREVLEASLIIGILYTYLVQADKKNYIPRLWQGVFLAIFTSIIFSVIFQSFAGGFKGSSAKIFEGIVMIIAAGVLGTMIFWMVRNINIRKHLEDEASRAIDSNNAQLGIFALSFVAVFREGVEIILFMYGIMYSSDGISIYMSLLGSIAGLAVGYLIFIQGRKVPLKTFFSITSVLLIFVCSGMLTYGVHELESGGLIPYVSGSVDEDEGSLIATRINGATKVFDEFNSEGVSNRSKAAKWASRIWDINPDLIQSSYTNKDECPIDHKWNKDKSICYSYPILHDKGRVGQLAKGFFGYNGDPSMIEFLFYIFSLTGMLYLWFKVKNSTNEDSHNDSGSIS